MDKFEKILREKLQNHEAPMPKGAWEKFSQRLDAVQVKPNPIRNYLIGGIAAVTIGFGVYSLLPSDSNSPVKQNMPVAQNNKVENNTINNNSVSSVESNSDYHNTVTNEIKTENPVKPNTNTVKQENKSDNKVTVNEIKKENNEIKTDNKENPIIVNHTPVKSNEEKTITLSTPEIAGNIREVCQNTDCNFKAANSKPEFDITWLLNGEEVSHESEFKANFTKTGNNTIQLVYASVQNGKRIAKESEKRSIQVLALPDASFEIIKLNEEAIPEYKFRASDLEGSNYTFNCGDGKVLSGAEVTHIYRKKGIYTTTLTITAQNGCKSRQTEKLEIESDYNLLAPNSFTPNGDGRNDVFIPEALKIMSDVQFRMTIFDKSGKKIFETSRVDNAWDGRNTVTGGMCGRDAYVWRVEITKPNGSKEEYMGSVTLLD